MAWVIIALLPAGIWGVILFGLRSAIMVLVSTGAAVLTEFVLNRIFRRDNTLGDLSAVVTGLLIGYNMPPHIPLFIPVAASIFAIGIVKWSFGGLGANWMNPALAGRVFASFSWGALMTKWTMPSKFDVISGATPLSIIKVAQSPVGMDSPMEVVNSTAYPLTYLDLFLGRMPGSLGEVSALLLILGGLFLVGVRIINWEIPFSYIVSFALFIWIFDGIQYGSGFFSGDVLFHLFTGGLMLGAWFMASDLVTTPLVRKGRLVFGIGCGVLTFIIRHYGSLPEGVSLAIIFMNILTPLFDKYIVPKRYGMGS